MDPSLRWLRRYVVVRAVERLSVEAVAAGVASGAGAAWFGASPVAAVTLGLVAGPVVAVLRLATALAINPVGARYLLSWTNPAPWLERDPAGGGRADPSLDRWGFRFLLRLVRSGPVDGGGADTVGAGDEPGDEADGLDLFRDGSGRVVLARGDGGDLTLVSRVSDGRLLFTSASLLPPRAGLLVNTIRSGSLTDLARAHLDRLHQLTGAGLEAVVIWPDAIIELLRLEWEAWQDLGPLIGPLLAVDGSRPSRARLEVRVPTDLVWQRCRVARPVEPRGSMAMPDLTRPTRPIGV
jgi:hypothetical protein